MVAHSSRALQNLFENTPKLSHEHSRKIREYAQKVCWKALKTRSLEPVNVFRALKCRTNHASSESFHKAT